MSERPYPDEPAGPFPTPPRTFTDGEGREITIRVHEGRNGAADDAFDALVRMYVDFDPADRAQGIPPIGERRVRDWLDVLMGGFNVIAWHDDRAVGHATLVPDGAVYELAIFVHQDYQHAGVGTELIRLLLGYGASEGVERVWLTVERWNQPAVSLYHSQGFETTEAESFELEMSLSLDQSSVES